LRKIIKIFRECLSFAGFLGTQWFPPISFFHHRVPLAVSWIFCRISRQNELPVTKHMLTNS